MIKAISLSLVAVLSLSVAGCKKKEEAKPAPVAAENKPAETPPAEPAKPADPAAGSGSAAAAPAGDGLASIAIPQAKSADPEILTGGQPTDDQLKQAKEKGVKTIVNLRSKGEEKEFATEEAKAKELGLNYVHIPIDGKTGDGLNEENAKKLAELVNQKPAIVHCASGQRVGALFALKAFYVDKKSPEEALAVGKANGLSKPELEKIVTDKMAAKKG
jgi:uncharacterized protein (TIGR01244 family)